MPESDAKHLVALLRGVSLRNRTGVLLLSPAWLGREADLAARLGISFEDHRGGILSRLSPGQRFLGIGWTDLISGYLDRLACGTSTDGGCTLVANVDVTLSSLRSIDRSRFWGTLREEYRPASSLLLTLPGQFQRLIPEDEYHLWASAQRLARWD